MPLYYLALELPKTIINGPIQGLGFETSDTLQPIFALSLSVPNWIAVSGRIDVFAGIMLDRDGTLLALTLAFLSIVLLNGFMRLRINTLKGRIGERMLRRIRYELFDRVLRMPVGRFRRVRSTDLAIMIKDEVDPLGGFIGDAFALPAFLLSQAITALVFIMVQNVVLGLVALCIMAIQVTIVPRMRQRLIELGENRQTTARVLASDVSDIVEGAATVHTNDTSNFERSRMTQRLGTIVDIRFELHQRKFLIKHISDLVGLLAPFIFYLIGGWFAIRGQLDVGQLVAVIGAYKELPTPVRDLIGWDQQRIELRVKYNHVVDQFDVPDMIPSARHAPHEGPVPRLSGEIALRNLSVVDDSGAILLDRVTTTFGTRDRVLVTGRAGDGPDAFAELLVRLVEPRSGRIAIGDQPLAEMPDAVTGRRIGYVPATAPLPAGSLRNGLVYGLKTMPRQPGPPPSTDREREELMERLRAGNSTLPFEADWTDYAAAGAEDAATLERRIRTCARIVGLEADIYALGLRSLPDAAADSAVAARLLEARREFRRRLEAADGTDTVDTFDPTRYLPNASVLENLVLGVSADRAAKDDDFAAHPRVRRALAETGLDRRLFAMGRSIAETLVEIFGDLAPDNPLLQRMTIMDPADLPLYRSLLRRLATPEPVSAFDTEALHRLAFAYVEPRHRLGLIDPTVQEEILVARKAFRQMMPEELPSSVMFHDPDLINPASTIQDNVLFGRVAGTMADSHPKVEKVLRETLEDLGLVDVVMARGLDFDVGAGGRRLGPAQLQKALLLRALLKRPDLIVANRALSAVDATLQQEILERLIHLSEGREGFEPFGIVWVPAAGDASNVGFDRTIAFEANQIKRDEATGAGRTPAVAPVGHQAERVGGGM